MCGFIGYDGEFRIQCNNSGPPIKSNLFTIRYILAKHMKKYGVSKNNFKIEHEILHH